jgi:hypothetical protein
MAAVGSFVFCSHLHTNYCIGDVFWGQHLLMCATDLMAMYVCLELQSFALVVLCRRSPFFGVFVCVSLIDLFLKTSIEQKPRKLQDIPFIFFKSNLYFHFQKLPLFPFFFQKIFFFRMRFNRTRPRNAHSRHAASPNAGRPVPFSTCLHGPHMLPRHPPHSAVRSAEERHRQLGAYAG